MAEPSIKRASYQDVLDAPAHKVAEIINGVLHLFPRPALPHASVTSNLLGELVPGFNRGRGGPGGWIILVEPELRVGDDILVPDLAGWRRDRMPAGHDIPNTDIAPDWICEVLSKSTEKVDRSEKLAIYAAHGVKHAWLVSPKHRTLEVLRLLEGRWLVLAIHHDDAKVRAEPFDALELDLAVVWTDLDAFGLPGRVSEAVASYQASRDEL